MPRDMTTEMKPLRSLKVGSLMVLCLTIHDISSTNVFALFFGCVTIGTDQDNKKR